MWLYNNFFSRILWQFQFNFFFWRNLKFYFCYLIFLFVPYFLLCKIVFYLFFIRKKINFPSFWASLFLFHGFTYLSWRTKICFNAFFFYFTFILYISRQWAKTSNSISFIMILRNMFMLLLTCFGWILVDFWKILLFLMEDCMNIQRSLANFFFFEKN